MRGCALIVVWLLERSFFRMCIPPCGGEFDFPCGGTIRVLLPHAVWMPRMRIGCCAPLFVESAALGKRGGQTGRRSRIGSLILLHPSSPRWRWQRSLPSLYLAFPAHSRVT